MTAPPPARKGSMVPRRSSARCSACTSSATGPAGASGGSSRPCSAGGRRPGRRGRRRRARVSVALTVYNRSTLALEAVRQVAADPRIAEIVVSDDASEPSEYRRLCAIVGGTGPKVRIHRNDRNRGPLWNKHHAVSLCTSEFAILFDSDNVLDPAYLDRLFRAAPWRRDCFYCPEFARPRFDLRLFGGVTLDLALVRRHDALGLARPPHRRAAQRRELSGPRPRVRRGHRTLPGPAPCTWTRSPPAISGCAGGGRLHVLKGLAYDHRVHDGSYSQATREDTTREIAEIRDAILAERPWPAGGAGAFTTWRADSRKSECRRGDVRDRAVAPRTRGVRVGCGSWETRDDRPLPRGRRAAGRIAGAGS